jgi:hypothetical protein
LVFHSIDLANIYANISLLRGRPPVASGGDVMAFGGKALRGLFVAAVPSQLGPSIGIPAPVLEVALTRQSYGIQPIDKSVIADQQKIADLFHQLGLLPKPVKISDAVRSGS